MSNLNNHSSPYTTTTIRDKGVLRRFMQQDRALCAFALGDLNDKWWDLSTFFGTFDDNNTLQAIGLVRRGFETPALQMFGHPDAVEALLVSDVAPESVFGMVTDNLKDVFGKYYAHEETSTKRFWRMAVTATEFTAGSSRHGLEQLGRKDFDAIADLLTKDGHQVSTEEIEGGVFYGIKDKMGMLVAIAGTLVCAPSEHVGVVGHVYTDPAARGRGYATATTSAVTQELFRIGADTVALNVVQSNASAIRVYQKLGYRIHLPLTAGIVRKAVPTF
jgi:ribosomal protein S18 acetylase RimI-like enzyme